MVVAGKGHETYQIVGDAVQHFNDRDEVRAALAHWIRPHDFVRVIEGPAR